MIPKSEEAGQVRTCDFSLLKLLSFYWEKNLTMLSSPLLFPAEIWSKLGKFWKRSGVLPCWLCDSAMGSSVPRLLLCSIVFSSQWVFGCVGHCRDSVTELTWGCGAGAHWSVQNNLLSRLQTQSAEGTTVVNCYQGASNRSDDGTKILPNGTKILPKWGKITLSNTVCLVLARHHFSFGPEGRGWQSSSADTNFFTYLCIFSREIDINWLSVTWLSSLVNILSSVGYWYYLHVNLVPILKSFNHLFLQLSRP